MIETKNILITIIAQQQGIPSLFLLCLIEERKVYH